MSSLRLTMRWSGRLIAESAKFCVYGLPLQAGVTMKHTAYALIFVATLSMSFTAIAEETFDRPAGGAATHSAGELLLHG